MLEFVDLKQRISKEDYQRVFPDLERELGECQRRSRMAGVPVVVVFEGWEAAGKGTMINGLAQVLDPRGFKVHPILAPNEQEQFHPWMWRFWQRLPAAGNWALFDQSWYGRVLRDRVDRRIPPRQWKEAFDDIREFERQLTDSGVVLVKFWLQISQKEQRKRFEQLRSHRATAWKIGKDERRQHRRYDAWNTAIEDMLQRTSDVVPWTVVEATQERFCRVKVFQTIAQSLGSALAGRESSVPAPAPAPPVAAPPAIAAPTILEQVDLSHSLTREEYDSQLKGLQKRLFELEHRLYLARVPAAIVYEGWDAAGKGGNIKRLTRGLDPRGYEVVPIAAPTTEEKAHHYLWRFWQHVPKAGHIAIFDRSWYGRVLVERVEGFCTEPEWRRAYDEINQFERQLAESGTVVVKFWLQIDADEQLRRFQEREQTPFKKWKITGEDWRNREKRKAYEPAVVDMLRLTSTAHAPWTILEANCKLHARIKALQRTADALEAGIEAKRQG